MKRKICLLFLILLMTGCTANYELEIYNDTVIEKATPWYSKTEVSNDPFEYTKQQSLKYDDNGDFLFHNSKKTVKKEALIGVELTNKYDTLDTVKTSSKIIHYCYYAKNIVHTKKEYITVKTSNEFLCLNEIEELEHVTISIKSNHKLKETNADEIKGHTYYWYITKENYQKKPISLVLYSDQYVWNYDNEILKRLGLIILVIGGTVLVSSGIYKIYKKAEEEV